MAANELHTADAIDDTSLPHKNVTGTTIGTKRCIDVTSLGADGVTDVNGAPIVWDTITYAEPTTSSETYTYSFNSTDLVIYTVTYTDDTKETLASNAVVKSAP